MAKRLHMTTADYVAIAISPALIMALVGSLVFFLIAVMYTGEYVGRLDYAFALFVFATVLIARISIDMGAERASFFALALGVVMFLALLRFVQHPSPFSHLINLALMGVVWWCAHKLTWDCTLIDDNEDASGEGLMQRIGVDGPADREAAASGDGAARNELLPDTHGEPAAATPWWRRFIRTGPRRHTPGLWVLYFSLAALPLFGIGQSWIPVADVGRRRYAFTLLLIYVAAALSLLVTTSFLGLRRYLRQRRIEMPIPVAGTWIALGAALIAIVMFLAMLIPRPAAEVALSRVPWKASSPGGLSPSRYSVGNDGQQQQDGGTPTNDQPDTNNSDTQAPGPNKGAKGESKSGAEKEGEAGQDSSHGQSDKTGTDSGSKASESKSQPSNGDKERQSAASAAQNGEKKAEKKPSQSSDSGANRRDEQSKDGNPGNQSPTNSQSAKQPNETKSPDSSNHPSPTNSPSLPQTIVNVLGGLGGILKLAIYAVMAMLIGYLVWKHRQELARAISDILRELRALIARLFGGTSTANATTSETSQSAAAPSLRFADFRDPFATGDSRRLSPEEIVRYTFSAFEAWANDHGCPRTPDRTPAELVRAAVAAESPMYAEARKMIRLYGEVAYAARKIPREAANTLQQLWATMAQG